MTEARLRRAELATLVLHLRDRGLSRRQIACELDVSRHFVRAVLHTREGGHTTEHVLGSVTDVEQLP